MRTFTFLRLVLALTLGVLGMANGQCRAGALLKPSGQATEALREKTLSIETNITGAFAQTVLTTVYSNPNSQRTEADFVYKVPEGAVVTGFAYWCDGEKVVARVVEKARAAQIYQYITSRMRDPALIEMVGHRTFRARIFPVEGGVDLKVEIRMVQALLATPRGLVWRYPLIEESKRDPLEELSVSAVLDRPFTCNLGGETGGKLAISRNNFTAQADLTFTAPYEPKDKLWSLSARDGGRDGFFALGIIPDRTLVNPAPKIKGVHTYSVIGPGGTWKANTLGVIVGRYKGSGEAYLHLGEKTYSLQLQDRSQPGTPAALLWAAARLDEFGKKSKFKADAITLSHRFGLPCTWTSWLAIPVEERERYRGEMLSAELDTRGRAYAQAVARGDRREASRQKATFAASSRALREYSKTSDWPRSSPTLESYLDQELWIIQEARDTASDIKPSQIAQWTSWSRRLKKAGANDGYYNQDAYYRVCRVVTNAANKLAGEVEAGRWKSGAARASGNLLRRQLQSQTARAAGLKRRSFVGPAARSRMQIIGRRMVELDLAGKKNSAIYKRDQARLKRLAVWSGNEWSRYVADALSNEFYKLDSPMAEEVLERRDGQKRHLELRARMHKIQDRWMGNHYDLNSYRVGLAWKGRAHEAAYLLLKERVKLVPDKDKITQLEEELTKAASQSMTPKKAFLDWEEGRMKWDDHLVLARDYALRQGDPLIAVQAPADCIQVVAILPSGELKPLAWNGVLKRWEARFDVPGYATQGGYKITILIVNSDGRRRQLAMDYKVDTTAPRGTPGVLDGGDQWNLSCEVDNDVVLVDAFTPWGTRVGMTRSANLYSGITNVPAEWKGRNGAVTYVLTDKAHNRTSIVVDMSDESK